MIVVRATSKCSGNDCNLCPHGVKDDADPFASMMSACALPYHVAVNGNGKALPLHAEKYPGVFFAGKP